MQDQPRLHSEILSETERGGERGEREKRRGRNGEERKREGKKEEKGGEARREG